jgi:hypothetical protein
MTGFFTATGASALALVYALLGAVQVTATRQDKVAKTFKSFQEALVVKDPLKIWALLDKDSQNSAKQAAELVKSSCGFAGPDEKAKMIATYGLPGEVLGALSPPGFVGTKVFLGKYRAVPVSKIADVALDGDRATIVYVDPDGDKGKLSFRKRGPWWKMSAPMPAVVRPSTGPP